MVSNRECKRGQKELGPTVALQNYFLLKFCEELIWGESEENLAPSSGKPPDYEVCIKSEFNFLWILKNQKKRFKWFVLFKLTSSSSEHLCTSYSRITFQHLVRSQPRVPIVAIFHISFQSTPSVIPYPSHLSVPSRSPLAVPHTHSRFLEFEEHLVWN